MSSPLTDPGSRLLLKSGGAGMNHDPWCDVIREEGKKEPRYLLTG